MVSNDQRALDLTRCLYKAMDEGAWGDIDWKTVWGASLELKDQSDQEGIDAVHVLMKRTLEVMGHYDIPDHWELVSTAMIAGTGNTNVDHSKPAYIRKDYKVAFFFAVDDYTHEGQIAILVGEGDCSFYPRGDVGIFAHCDKLAETCEGFAIS